jgi:hypothetical protein
LNLEIRDCPSALGAVGKDLVERGGIRHQGDKTFPNRAQRLDNHLSSFLLQDGVSFALEAFFNVPTIIACPCISAMQK